MTEPIIKIENLKKRFGKSIILDGLSLEIKEGDVLGLIGRSGSGKSTLMKILIGYYARTSGKIYYKGEDISKDIEKIRKIVGYTTQDNSFYDKLTIYENMDYYSNLYNVKKLIEGKKLKQHIEEILDSVELLKSKKSIADNISGGMKRRLDFAISLLHKPDILILDEPTAGLDPLLVKQFWSVVNKILKENKTAIISSHIFSEIEDNCNKVAVLEDGKITQVIDMKKFKVKRDKLYKIFSKGKL